MCLGGTAVAMQVLVRKTAESLWGEWGDLNFEKNARKQ